MKNKFLKSILFLTTVSLVACTNQKPAPKPEPDITLPVQVEDEKKPVVESTRRKDVFKISENLYEKTDAILSSDEIGIELMSIISKAETADNDASGELEEYMATFLEPGTRLYEIKSRKIADSIAVEIDGKFIEYHNFDYIEPSKGDTEAVNERLTFEYTTLKYFNADPSAEEGVTAEESKVVLIRSLEELKNTYPITEDERFNKYDEAFFNDKYLAFVPFDSGSGSMKHSVKRIYTKDDTLYIIVDSYSPLMMTMDYVHWSAVVELDKTIVVENAKAIY